MKTITKYTLSIFTLLAVMMLSTSCEHKPLDPRAPEGSNRLVRLNIDWSLLENESEHPEGVTVLFYDTARGGYLKFDLPRDKENTLLSIPSGVKHLYVYNNDEADFLPNADNDYTRHQLIMQQPYVGLNKIYYFSDDVTVYPPAEGEEQTDIQDITVKPACATPHIHITVLGTETIKKNVTIWGAQINGMLDDIMDNHSGVQYHSPVTISTVLQPADETKVVGSIRTMGIHPFAYNDATPAKLILSIIADNGSITYYAFNIIGQIKEQNPTHNYNIVVDLNGAHPLTPDDPDYPGDATGGAVNPAVDPFGTENIEIEMK